MKKFITFLSLLVVMGLAGCCSPSHAVKWEYKVVIPPQLPMSAYSQINTSLNSTNFMWRAHEQQRVWNEHVQGYLDELGKEGWQLVGIQDGTYYLKRPVK
jgi:hypothetical protein